MDATEDSIIPPSVVDILAGGSAVAWMLWLNGLGMFSHWFFYPIFLFLGLTVMSLLIGIRSKFSQITWKIFHLAMCGASIIAFSASCDMRDTRLKSFDKDHWIQVAMGTPLPAGMADLQGIGDTWQGFWCHFRFRIPAANLKDYLEMNGYEEHPVSDFVRHFTIDPRYEKFFSPAWNPVLDPSKKVFGRTPSGYSTYILVSPGSEEVHVWTGGSHSPGPFPENHQAQPPR